MLSTGSTVPAPVAPAAPKAPTIQDATVSEAERRKKDAARIAATVLTSDTGLDGKLGQTRPGAAAVGVKGTMG